jgi:hypothetical protein
MFFSRDKLTAFLIHLVISATIVGIVFVLIFYFWYPRPYFETNGAWKVLRILVMVDLVMGPMLTLVLFKKGKSSLILDMCFIAAVQLAALIYGVHVIYGERPYYLAFAVDRFEVIGKVEIDKSMLNYPDLKIKPNQGPILVFADFPADKKEREKFLFSVVMEGQPDLERRPEYYHPYLSHKDKVIEKAKPLAELIKSNGKATIEIDKFLSRQGGKQEDYLYLPLVGKNNDLALAIDKVSGLPVDGISVNPW